MGLVLWSENAIPPCGDFTRHHHHSQTQPLHWSPLAQNHLYEPLLHHPTLLFHLPTGTPPFGGQDEAWEVLRSEEHTSELQSHSDLVCRLLLEKKKKTQQLQYLRMPHYTKI